MQGDKPAVRIEGDVQLAAEINWLADHVRWDLEEDLARIMGDAPAHMVVQAGRTLAQGLGQFVGKRTSA
jgi:ubiquinone biosynthesis protein UbiJ